MATKSHGVGITVDSSAVGEITAVNFSGGTTAVHDTTNHATSTARTFTGGLSDSGTVEIEGNYVESDAGQTKLRENQGGSPVSCVVTYSDGTTATFSAVITDYSQSNPLDDIVTFSASCKISGDITWAAA